MLFEFVRNLFDDSVNYCSYRSEMHNPAVMVRYSLILESYLRANREHLLALVKQKDALSKLTFVNQLIKMDRYRLEDQVFNQKVLLSDKLQG